MPYAALQGEAPALDRAHVFWVAGWEPSQRVFGGDLVK